MERIGPGALLAGRYRLVERVHADPVAALWRAEDVTLERPAAVRVLAPGHTHVDSTLDAARRAAIVDDARLQRVLGVGVEAGCGYVILEWVEGPGAADLAGRVAESEARRIVREAAQAVETARTRGLRHGRLTPGHVRRTADGRVRVIGLAVDAATIGRPYLTGPDAGDPADLVAILYALITGHHPMGFVEGLLGAPTSGGRPVSLRELRPDASADLDELCVRTFAGTPPATAGDVALALAADEDASGGSAGPPAVAVVGAPLPGGADRWRSPSAVDLTDAGATAVAASRVPVQSFARDDEGPALAAASGTASTGSRPAPVTEIDLRSYDDDASTPAEPFGPTSAAVGPGPAPVGSQAAAGPSTVPAPHVPVDAPAVPSAAGTPPAPRSGDRRAVVALRDTIAAHASTPRWRRSAGPRPSAGSTRPSGMEWSGRGSAGVREDDDWSILPVPADGPEDPVWQARYEAPEWDQPPLPGGAAGSPPAVRETWDPGPLDGVDHGVDHGVEGRGVGAHGPQDEAWTADDVWADDREGSGTRRRRGLVAGFAIAALSAVVAVVAVWAVTSVRDPADVTAADADASAQPTSAAPSPVASPEPPPPPAPVVPVAVQPLDPFGDNAENDELVTLAIDGDPATAWQSLAYETQAFGNLKDGLGIVVNLGDVVPTGGLSITAPGEGGTFEVRSSAQPVFEGSTLIADGATSAAGPVQLTWDPVETQYLVVWFTALPQNDGRWRAVVSEVAPT